MQSAMHSCIEYESRRQSGRLVVVPNSFILLPRDAGNKTCDISKPIFKQVTYHFHNQFHNLEGNACGRLVIIVSRQSRDRAFLGHQ